MTHIHFIVNPIAGRGNNSLSKEMLRSYFDAENYEVTIKNSAFRGNAITLAQESIAQKANIIVACGGDGTINEVASTLVDTSILLGIVPIGSGNGLASDLKIPREIHRSLIIIKNQNVLKVDVGCMNQRYFFCNTGIGFTASVIENYESLNKRTLLSYIKATLKSFYHFCEKEKISIFVDGGKEIINPFMVFVSNSNIMGYGMSLTPKATLNDGLLDVIIVPKINKLKILFFGFCMLTKKLNLLKEVQYFQTDNVSISRKEGLYYELQIDGELSKIRDKSISISLKERSLNVIA